MDPAGWRARGREREKRGMWVLEKHLNIPRISIHYHSTAAVCLFYNGNISYQVSVVKRERERWKVKKEGRGRGTWKNIALVLSFLFSDMNPLKKKKLPAKKSAWSHLNVYKDNKLRVVLLFSYQTDVTLKSWPMCIFSKKLFFIIDYRGSSVIFIMDKVNC